MLNQKTKFKKNHTKTLLIIIGVIIAFLMTMTSPLFTAENGITVEPDQTNTAGDFHPEGSSSKPNYNSGTRLLHIFTKNLPYLNNK